MFAGNGAGMGTRGGVRAGNGAGLTTLQVGNTSGGLGGGMSTGIAMPDGGRYDEREPAEVVVSCSDAESDSGDDEDIGSAGDRRGVKRERAEMEVGVSVGAAGLAPCGYGASAGGGAAGAKPGKKTRGRVKIKMEFIDNKLRRYTTFSKRKTGIMKKAYELSTLTGTQVLLLVASETGHAAYIQRSSAWPPGPEETELSYQVAEGGEDGKAVFTLSSLQSAAPSSTSTPPSSSSSSSSPPPPPLPSSTSAITSSSSTAPCWSVGANGTVLKSTGTPAHGNATSAGVVLPPGFTIMSGSALPPGTHTIPLSQLQTHALTIQTSAAPTAATATPHALQTLQSLPTLQAVHAPQQTQPVGLPVVTATTSAAAVAPVTHTLSSLPLQQGAPTHTFLRLPVSLAGAGLPQQLQLQVQASSHQGGAISSSSDSTSTSDINHITVSSSASHPTTIITSSSSSSVAAAGHMMYSSPHAVMYATPTHAEGGGGLTVLNPFPPHSHSQAQDTGGVPQMFFTGPQGTVHAVPLHSMLIGQQQPGGGGSSNLTELRVVSLDSGKAD
ncbi:hypothetical protein AALO_G00093910 [Alosa alosa]|uniref:MADS-box domain-containing protein n=1 Tax=Alosa alosa TaxID=278164 RepID=A0AAV6GSR6_9TELE|nr:hypothetical protein AALO_G00093910 [Alosa alosa]